MSEEKFNAKRLVENAWNNSKLTPVNALAEKLAKEWCRMNFYSYPCPLSSVFKEGFTSGHAAGYEKAVKDSALIAEEFEICDEVSSRIYALKESKNG